MVTPAKVLDLEASVQERDEAIEHTRSDIAEMKTDLRRLNDKIEDVDKRLGAKCDSLKDQIASLALAMEKGFGDLRTKRAWDRVWWMVIAGSVLGVLARGFKWI